MQSLKVQLQGGYLMQHMRRFCSMYMVKETKGEEETVGGKDHDATGSAHPPTYLTHT